MFNLITLSTPDALLERPCRQLEGTMWTRTYLILLLVRIYFAVSPSYIHPDENFQGPEVIAGELSGRIHDAVLLELHIHPGSMALMRITRSDIRPSTPPDLGIHLQQACPQHLPIMARLRASHAGAQMGVGRSGDWICSSSSHVLRLESADVHPELRPRGLGYP